VELRAIKQQTTGRVFDMTSAREKLCGNIVGDFSISDIKLDLVSIFLKGQK